MSTLIAKLMAIESYLNYTSDEDGEVSRNTIEELAITGMGVSAAHTTTSIWHGLNSAFRHHAARRLALDGLRYVVDLVRELEALNHSDRETSINRIIAFLDKGNVDSAEDVASAVFERLSISANERTPIRLVESTDLKTVLLCDNEQYFLDRVATFLSSWLSPFDRNAFRVVAAKADDPFRTAVELLESDFSIRGVVIDWDLGLGKQHSGPQLARWVGGHFPDKYVALLTGRFLDNIVNDEIPFRCRPFSKADASGLDELATDLWCGVNRSVKAPFFEALLDYSERSISVYHALTTSRGRVIKASPSLVQFRRFYGDRFFSVETSSTMHPLDSLLDPSGTLHDAQKQAAQAFGADHTFFVTGGTSAANKIVHQALLRPGDKVLIDQNCHKSHHYAMVLADARPVYLHAEPITVGEVGAEDDCPTDIFSGIRISEIVANLEKAPDAKMLCLTNCTFDGIIHDPVRIIDEVTQFLARRRQEEQKKSALSGMPARAVTDPSEFIFFFDEAWFAFARFTASLRRYTAMWAAAEVPTARIYSTQSTHKTMIAFRQGSMIHIRDPKWNVVSGMFKEAMYTHSTTSPNASMLASMDIGRVWALTDGPQLCEDAIAVARTLRSAKYARDGEMAFIRPLNAAELQANEPHANNGSEFALDPTKISFQIHKSAGITGQELRSKLHDEFDIQLNKTTNNTILAMTNAGSTASTAMHLVHAIQQINSRLAADIVRQPNELRREGRFGRKVIPIAFVADIAALREYFFEIFPTNWCRKSMSLEELIKALDCKNPLSVASARFVIPYPPGFPVLVPGQMICVDHVQFLQSLSNKEVHGMMRRGFLEVVVNQQ